MPEIPKIYEPQAVEAKWYQFWLDRQCFTADPARVSEKRPAYSIVIPPPNITGVLHMGHVLNNTVQDILARKARMDGKEVLWLPGTDHASIATHMVLERELKKKEGVTRYDLGREKFIERAWEWKAQYGSIIIAQLKKLGCSCDWTRERFTMDPEYSHCVEKVFVELYKKGLIYRGKRMVNWCPATLTALSDEEVEMEPQKGFLWYFKVEVAEQPGTFLTIAPTRPETIPGDTAVAVNPKDPRYARLIGKHAIRPLPAELPHEKKLVPIIADEQIDPEFGTGVLKVTPAHDKADFEIGRRHNLPAVDIMNPNATMNDLAGADLGGLDRFEARKVAVEKLKALGALVKEEPYENKIGFSQRAKVPIEPRLSEQWFLEYPSVDKAQACVEQEGSAPGAGALPEKMRFHPQRWGKVYDHWMNNIQDWCISRQLWWGHRIPVWTKESSRQELVTLLPRATLESWKWTDETRTTRYADGSLEIETLVDQAIVREKTDHKSGETRLLSVLRLKPKDGDRVFIEVATYDEAEAAQLETKGFARDPDVLDTWCSSWLWPFATMGWTGDKTQDAKNATLQTFYPTTDLVTAPDIIFFWVARMIMAGYEYMGQPAFGLADASPFRNVYFTGIIRDKQGRKMSKSLGNSPDPLDLIGQHGADALRFGVMRAAPLGQDILFDEQNVELGRNFCNKLWNACRFRQMQGGQVQGEIEPTRLRSDDKWILLKLHQAIKELNGALVEYKFNEATATLYRFFWSEYCDWYVESSKAVLARPVAPPDRAGIGASPEVAPHPLPDPNQPQAQASRTNVLAVMDFVLSHTLRLFHPFLPFITEELWHGMGYAQDMPERQGGVSILLAPWPKPFDAAFRDHYALDDCYLDYVNQKFDLVTKGRNLRSEARIAANKKVKFILKPAQELPPNDLEVLKLLLNAESLEIDPEYRAGKDVASVKAELGELYLPLEGLVDLAATTSRLTKELEKISLEISKVEQKLANPAFVQKAPPEVLADHRKRLEDWRAQRDHVQKTLDGLKS